MREGRPYAGGQAAHTTGDLGAIGFQRIAGQGLVPTHFVDCCHSRADGTQIPQVPTLVAPTQFRCSDGSLADDDKRVFIGRKDRIRIQDHLLDLFL